MTLVNADGSSAPTNQLLTPTGGNVNCSVAELIYDGVSDLWIVISYF